MQNGTFKLLETLWNCFRSIILDQEMIIKKKLIKKYLFFVEKTYFFEKLFFSQNIFSVFQLKSHLKSIFQKSILNDFSIEIFDFRVWKLFPRFFFSKYFFKLNFLHEKKVFFDDFFFKVHLLNFSFPTHPVSAPNSQNPAIAGF